MASPALTINGRYQLDRKPVGHGGMGVVYRAYDIATKRYVALKTMRGSLSPAVLELFSKEWTVLAQLSHPNIVDVLDTGEFEQDGEIRPFFVMPFLPGATLDQLMQNASPRITVERVVGIVSQTCRGLQAAHERGLIHRDLKPSNIFVLDDDSVKIIDFGIVHLAGSDSLKGLKGTLQYMAPEQIELKPCSAASDIFSLGVVSYEALTGRKPFARKAEHETAEAIRLHNPPPICDLNPLISRMVSRVIHKALAKDPWHRFSTAREYADSLQRALKGESLDRFDRAKIQPRIDRAKRAHAEGDHQFASEILTELEAEGNIDPEMSLLRVQIDHAVRQKSIRQLLDSARTRLEEDEFPLALQKIQEALKIDPDNPDAIALKNEIEKQRSRQQTQNWFRLVDQHIHNQSFVQARQALQEILKLHPNDTRALNLLTEVERKEQDLARLLAEKEQLYQSALSCYQHGEISSALTKLERILDLARQSPDSAIPERDAQYQNLYNQIRTERETARNAYAEGRRYLADRSFGKALEICNEFLKRSPGDPMFQALKLEVEEQVRQEQSAFIADVSRRVEAEPDLDRRVNILKEAVQRYPEEAHLQQGLRLVRDRRDLVNSIVGKARQYEERGQYNEALSQFDILRNIYSQYPGLDFETERLKRRRDDQVREESKGRWVEQIDRQIALGDYIRAGDLVRTALAEFPDDRELAGLGRLAEANLKRAAEAEEWLQRGQKLCFERRFEEGLDALHKAASLDNRSAVIRAALLNALVEQARSVLGQNWRAAELLIEQALHIDEGHPLARSLQGLVLDYKRQEIVSECISRARELQAAGDLPAALAKVEEILAAYPNEARLSQLRSTLRNLGGVSQSSPAVEKPLPQNEPPAPSSGVPDAMVTEGLPRAEPRQSAAEYSFLEASATAVLEKSSPPDPKDLSRSVSRWENFRIRIRNLGMRAGRKLRSSRGTADRLSSSQWRIILAGSVILVLAFVFAQSRRRTNPVIVPVASEFLVDVECNIATARYLVDGNPLASLPARLAAGAHKLEAFAPGFKRNVQSFTLSASGQKSQLISIRLEPELVRVRLSSDLKAAQVSLDGQPPVDLQDGGFGNDAVTVSQEHTLSLRQSGNETLAFSFRAEPGDVVRLSSPIRAKDIQAVVIASLSSRARVYATNTTLKGSLMNQPPQPIPAEGLVFSDLAGDTQFLLDDGKSARQVPIEVTNAPTLTVWLARDPNQGRLVIETKLSEAELTIDGRKRRPLRAGKNYYAIEPGRHVVHVSAEGYESAEQSVELKKGEERQLAIADLKPVARVASLAIEGASRDTQILIDGVSAGTVENNGAFRRDGVSPGNHTITLRKTGFEDRELTRSFSAGQIVHISGTDGQLTPFGSIDFRVSPQNAAVRYRRMDESSSHAAENGKDVRLKQGRYLVSASAVGRRDREEQISIEPGKSTSVDWMLAASEEPKKAPAAAAPAAAPKKTMSSRDYFTDAASWVQDGGFWVHKGANTSWLHDNQGTYLIELYRQTTGFGPFKKTKRVEWTIDQIGLSSHIDYRFDFSTLARRATVAGKEGSEEKNFVPQMTGDTYTLQIEISREQIVIKDAQGKELDRYERPNPGTPVGRFGFKGEVALVVRQVE